MIDTFASQNALERLINYTNSAEGSILPPRTLQGRRVPVVNGLTVMKLQYIYFNGTTVTLTWNDVIDGRRLVSGYNIYASNLRANNVQPVLVAQTQHSPAQFTISTDSTRPVTFFVQTILNGGLSANTGINSSNLPATSAVIQGP